MKKTIKIIVVLLLFLVVLPALAGIVVMALWNSIIPVICGFATITFWQGVGLFIIGQILSGGMLFTLFFVGSGIHVLGHHHEGWRNHLHSMTDEQRREFINRRRREHFGFHNSPNKYENATD